MGRLFRIAGVLAFCPVLASAHHSRAEFTDEDLELQGELLDVQWRNPHPVFMIKTMNGAGAEETWRLEAYGNALTLQRTGINGEMFSIGDTIRVAGKVSGRRDHVLLANHILLPDGTEAVLEYEAAPYFVDRHVGGSSSWVVDPEIVARAAAENRGLFRLWSLPMRGLDQQSAVFTDAAIAGRAAWDPLDNYLIRCELPGMPHIMRNPQPYEIAEGDGEIYVRAQFFAVERTIHMDNAEDPADQPPSRLGYSVGHWEDGTLVVETTRINWPYFDNDGTPQSDNVRVLERYTLSDDQSRLDFHMTVTDPATVKEPATFDRYWLALGGELQPYVCVPD